MPSIHTLMPAPCAESFEEVFTALARQGVLLLQDRSAPSVVGIVTGESLRTSWWSHPKSHLIFAVLSDLNDHPEVLLTKLINRKDTFVHAILWPEVLAIATSRDSWQVRGLSADAAELLLRVDRGDTPLRAAGPAVKELKARLLCTAREVHGESGRHEMVVESWQAWAARIGCVPVSSRIAATERIERAAAELGVSYAALPWRVSRR